MNQQRTATSVVVQQLRSKNTLEIGNDSRDHKTPSTLNVNLKEGGRDRRTRQQRPYGSHRRPNAILTNCQRKNSKNVEDGNKSEDEEGEKGNINLIVISKPLQPCERPWRDKRMSPHEKSWRCRAV